MDYEQHLMWLGRTATRLLNMDLYGDFYALFKMKEGDERAQKIMRDMWDKYLEREITREETRLMQEVRERKVLAEMRQARKERYS